MFEVDWAEARERKGDEVSAADLRRTPAQRRADASRRRGPGGRRRQS
jgi:hypothetical protein